MLDRLPKPSEMPVPQLSKCGTSPSGWQEESPGRGRIQVEVTPPIKPALPHRSIASSHRGTGGLDAVPGDFITYAGESARRLVQTAPPRFHLP